VTGCISKTLPPEVMVKSFGTLNVGQKELGPYFGSPKLSGNPQIFLNSAAPITETLGIHAFEGDAVLPMLAKSWEVSADGIVWTFNIRQGVEFHKGYGEMTAEDVQFSFEQVATSEKHPVFGCSGDFLRRRRQPNRHRHLHPGH